MSNIITEIEQSLNEVPPLKIDIKPVMQTAPAPDPLGGVKPIALPEAVPQPLQVPQPSAPVEPIPSTGSPVPEIPQVDALSYGDTISRMSAQSAAEIQKTIAASGAPKPNDVQNSLLNPNMPVQIDPKISSQANPFAGNKTENAQERLAFEPPVLANGLANPFSDPNARAAIAAGISKEEYIAYIRDVKSKGEETTFGVPLQPNNLPLAVLQQQQLSASWQGLTAEQIRKKMSEKSGYLSARRNFNTSFLPFAGSENRNELETLFAALSFPANLVKGVGLDVLRPAAAVISGGANIEEIKKAYEAMRPTKGGTFTGAAVLGQDFSSLAIADQKGAAFNPLAAVRDDKNLFQIALGFGLDILADPLNNDKVAELLFKPVGLFQRAKVPEIPTPPSAVALSREIVPIATEKYRQTPTRLVTTVAGDTPPVRPQPDRVPTPNTPPRVDVPASAIELPRQLEAPREVVIEREVARNNELAVYQPSEVVFPEARQPYTPIPDSRAIVPAPEINMYNNVTALFNDSPDLPVVQRLMRDVVEQKPFEQIPDARSLVVTQNPVLREVVEFAQTGDLTPNVAVLQGATVDEIADIVADRLSLAEDTPLVVPRLIAQPIEVSQVDYSIVTQLPRIEARQLVAPVTVGSSVPKTVDIEAVVPVLTTKPVVVSDAPFTSLSDLQDAARTGDIFVSSEVHNLVQKGDFVTQLKDVPSAVGDLSIEYLNTPSLPKVVKSRVGKLSNKAVKEVAESLARVDLKTSEDISKSLFDALWRKSTDEQKKLILYSMPTKRLVDLGLERVQTKVTPPTLPTFSHVRASTIDESVTSSYHVVNASQTPIESLRVAMLREQGLSGREASSMRVHPILEEIANTGALSDESLTTFLRSRELSISTPNERNWSSKMLQQMWEVATPEQKALIMSTLDAKTLEQLGFERVARSNVIDDHLPIETEFDTPC